MRATAWSTFHENVKIIEFHYFIWNDHRKCIQINTNMPCIGIVSSGINQVSFLLEYIMKSSLMPCIGLVIREIEEEKTIFHGKTDCRVKSVA